jgi:hypothetical protein
MRSRELYSRVLSFARHFAPTRPDGGIVRDMLALIAALLCIASLASAADDPAKPVFPYGAVYFRKSNPPETDWARDHQTASRIGMNAFRHWFMWGAVETAPGKYDWRDYDRMMDLAAQNGTKVAGTTGLEPATSDVTDRSLGIGIDRLSSITYRSMSPPSTAQFSEPPVGCRSGPHLEKEP